jgi:hypothetical protein
LQICGLNSFTVFGRISNVLPALVSCFFIGCTTAGVWDVWEPAAFDVRQSLVTVARNQHGMLAEKTAVMEDCSYVSRRRTSVYAGPHDKLQVAAVKPSVALLHDGHQGILLHSVVFRLHGAT